MKNEIQLTSLTPVLQPQWLNINNGVLIIKFPFSVTNTKNCQPRSIKSKVHMLSSLNKTVKLLLKGIDHLTRALSHWRAATKVPVIRTGGTAHSNKESDQGIRPNREERENIERGEADEQQ